MLRFYYKIIGLLKKKLYLRVWAKPGPEMCGPGLGQTLMGLGINYSLGPGPGLTIFCGPGF